MKRQSKAMTAALLDRAYELVQELAVILLILGGKRPQVSKAVAALTGNTTKKTRAAVTLGKLRAASLTPERRKEIAQKAAATRWNKKRQQDPLRTGGELRQYWLNRVGQSKANILGVLFNAWPHPVSIDELADLSGYTVNGHFNNMIGSLRTMGLITPPRQPIKAMDYLFEE